MSGTNADKAAGPLGAGAVTILVGSSFCITAPNGDVVPHAWAAAAPIHLIRRNPSSSGRKPGPPCWNC